MNNNLKKVMEKLINGNGRYIDNHNKEKKESKEFLLVKIFNKRKIEKQFVTVFYHQIQTTNPLMVGKDGQVRLSRWAMGPTIETAKQISDLKNNKLVKVETMLASTFYTVQTVKLEEFIKTL